MGAILCGMGTGRKVNQPLVEAPGQPGTSLPTEVSAEPEPGPLQGEQIHPEQQTLSEATKANSFSNRIKALSGLGNSAKSSGKSLRDSTERHNEPSHTEERSPRASWDTVLSATVPAVERTASGDKTPAKAGWKHAADAVKRKHRKGSLTGQHPIENAPQKLHEIPLAQVMGLRKEFEAVSAPKASMNFQQLNKFQARMIRRQGDAVFKALRANNPLVVNKGKHTEKDVREQAKKTAVQVFRSLGYWDHEEDKALAESTVTFEQYLAAVFSAKIKGPDKKQYDPTSAGLKGILRIQESSHEKVEDTLLKVPLEELDFESLPQREQKLHYRDNPSLEQLEEEWRLQQAQEKLELDAEEAAAFKLKNELDAVQADESVDVAEAAAFQAQLAELEAAHEADGDADPNGPVFNAVSGAETSASEDGAIGRAASSGQTSPVGATKTELGRAESAGMDAEEQSGSGRRQLREEGEGHAGDSIVEVRVYVLTEAEVKYKVANIEQVRAGVQKSKRRVAAHAGKS